MRAREILDEDYNQNLQSDLTNILIGAKGSGAEKLATGNVVAQLQNLGYSVDTNSIMALLSNNPAVMNATPEEVVLTQAAGETETGGSSMQDSASKVKSLAQKASSL